MWHETQSLRTPIGRAILGLLGAIVVSDLPAAAQPGRILVDNTGPTILEFNIDGSNGFAIAGNTDNNVVFNPSVAANGTIAFTANKDVDGTYLGHSYIFLMNADGTNVRNITSALPGSSSNCCYNLNPTISPDGTKVAFLATINVAADGSKQQEVYLVNADGSNLRQLTPFMDNPNSNPPTGDYSQSAMYGLAWNPDGTELAFRGSVYTSKCGTYGGQPIFVNVIGTIKTDGSNMQFLACDNGDGYVTSLEWSPDGALLAWGRNVSHGAQGCSGCVGEPAIAFLDFSGQNRYSAGITSVQLTTDSCQGGPHCIHFSPDSSQLAYVDAYPNNGNPCQSACSISFISLDGTGQTNSTIPSGGRTVWWEAGPAIPAPAQITVAGPNGPGSTVEVWPGFSQQLIPTLSDFDSKVILHTAQDYVTNHYFYASNCLTIGPFGLAVYDSGAGGSGYGTISATNAGLTSNTINFNCWPSSPCTFNLGSNHTHIPANGGTGMVSVSANPNPGSSGSTCPWSAKTNASWITITSGASGSANGNVNFRVTANSGAARQSTMTIAGLTYTVTQDAVGTVSLTTITVTPNPASVSAGLTLQFTATGNYSDGSMTNLTSSVTWTSSNSGIAAISNAAASHGLATGIATGGPVTIMAAQADIKGTAELTVTGPPVVNAVVNGASFAGNGIAPGEIGTIFGANLTNAIGITFASGLPLPTQLLSVSVLVNGSAAPIFAVDNVNGQQQINFQVPWGLAGQNSATIQVVNNSFKSVEVNVPVIAAQPGIFAYNAAGGSFGAILHANYQLADSGHPTVAGETVLIYCTGLGTVSSAPADGAAGNGETTKTTPVVTIGGVSATVSFSGLAPGFVGLYQVNAQVPAGLAAGNQPVVIKMLGAASNTVLLPVN